MHEKLAVEVEVSPGAFIGRRSLLGWAAGIGVMAATRRSANAAMRPGDAQSDERAELTRRSLAVGAVTYDEFLALANPLAHELVADTSREGQDRYLLALAALAVRLTDVAVPEMSVLSKGAAAKTFIGSNPGGDPFTVLHWRMEPGSVIGDHPHTYGNVVTLVLEGEVVIRNFEVVGEPDYDAKGPFRVRKTCESVLTRGGINLVSLERNYMHGFRAGPSGARGLDITTRIRPKHSTPSLELGPKPIDEALAIYEARWKA